MDTVARFDLVVRGGVVLDGSGSPGRTADVAILDGRIAEIGRVADRGARELDADGLVVAPGFVDMHSHADLAVMTEPDRWSAVSQGVTTEVVGQDGLGYSPLTASSAALVHERAAAFTGSPPAGGIDWRDVGEYLERAEGAAVNVATLASHGTLRLGVVGTEDRPATAEELAEMSRLLRRALAQGAVGLSSGLTYAPGAFASDDELAALCAVVAEAGGYYAPHHRSYGRGALEAYRDCLEIARRSGAALHLTHAHLSFAPNRGRADELLAMLRDARAEGLDVTLDSYPYDAGSSYLHAVLPTAAQDAPVPELLARLADPAERERLRVALEVEGTDGSHGVPVDWTRIVVASSGRADAVGRSIAELAAADGARAIDAYCDLLVADRLTATCIVHEGDEDNVRRIMTDPGHTGGSDGLLLGARPHPRAFGAFARFLGRYSRDLGIVPLPEMVAKLSGAPARRLRLADRGRVATGLAADLACFDPDRVADRATWEEPRRPAVGMLHVLVNGVPVLEAAGPTGARPGRALRAGAAA